ncbi:DUF1697 domain-containing protein [Plantactinospora sp. KBS50]|uniref:DUF1697 domain-containing protein n=1 Tax=Plantactinospora sp. KBS50 TaxID=2024580 RepID=UPI000BAAD9DD|nr:DUF1697 domain-containing protein [Plantactinospora sp. KBS50]ASW55834.1 hypothetical protein CIK06_19160 [Plantactinospora sp. KBS50]
MDRYALLLRGINLGRSRRVAMADLRELLTEQGYGDVATLLQSGNVTLAADLPPAELGSAVRLAIEQRFGMVVDVVVRTRDELARIVAGNPLADVAVDGSRYVVWFLAGPPPAAVVRALADADLGDDRYVLDGAEVYGWLPHGQRDSRLVTVLGKVKDGPTATARNWNTVEKLLAAMDRA